MANGNDQNQKDAFPKLSTDEEKALRRMATTGYSISGYTPNGAVFNLTRSEIQDIVIGITKRWIEDVEGCQLYIDKRTGEIDAYVTLPRNSHHIVSTSLKNQDSAIRRTLRNYSDSIKEYMDKFCPNKEKRVLPNGSTDKKDANLVAIHILLDRILNVEFDVHGVTVGKKFGREFQKNTKLELTPVFAKKNDDDDRPNNLGEFMYLKVEKHLPDTNKKARWVRKSRNFH